MPVFADAGERVEHVALRNHTTGLLVEVEHHASKKQHLLALSLIHLQGRSLGDGRQQRQESARIESVNTRIVVAPSSDSANDDGAFGGLVFRQVVVERND